MKVTSLAGQPCLHSLHGMQAADSPTDALALCTMNPVASMSPRCFHASGSYVVVPEVAGNTVPCCGLEVSP